MRLVQGQAGPVPVNRAGSVDPLASLVPSTANEEVHAIPFAIPERVVDEQRGVVNIRDSLLQMFGKLLIGNKQFLLARLDVHKEDAVVVRCVGFFRPIQRVRITGHQTQSRQAAVVQPEKSTGFSRHSTIADGCFIVAVLTYTFPSLPGRTGR